MNAKLQKMAQAKIAANAKAKAEEAREINARQSSARAALSRSPEQCQKMRDYSWR